MQHWFPGKASRPPSEGKRLLRTNMAAERASQRHDSQLTRWVHIGGRRSSSAISWHCSRGRRILDGSWWRIAGWWRGWGGSHRGSSLLLNSSRCWRSSRSSGGSGGSGGGRHCCGLCCCRLCCRRLCSRRVEAHFDQGLADLAGLQAAASCGANSQQVGCQAHLCCLVAAAKQMSSGPGPACSGLQPSCSVRSSSNRPIRSAWEAGKAGRPQEAPLRGRRYHRLRTSTPCKGRLFAPHRQAVCKCLQSLRPHLSPPRHSP